MISDHRRLPVLAALGAVYLIWGSTYLALRFGLAGGFTPFLMGGLRFLLAGGVLAVWARRRGTAWPDRRQWRSAAALGLLMLVGGVGLVTIAEDNGVGSGVIATAVAVMPLWVAILGIAFGHRPRPLEWAGLVVGFGGVALLSFEGDFAATTLGLVLAIVAPISWALGSLISRQLVVAPGLMGTAAQMLAGGILLAVLGLIRGETITSVPTLDGWLAVLYLAAFGSIWAYGAYMYLLATVRPAVATSYAYVNPGVAVVLGVTIGDEAVSGWTLGGLPVILLGVAIVGLAQRRRAPAARASGTGEP